MKNPMYRIVASDSRAPRDGRFLEILGQYDPNPSIERVNIDKERVLYWMSVGALPSDKLKSLLSKAGLWSKLTQELESMKKANLPETSIQIPASEKEDVE